MNLVLAILEAVCFVVSVISAIIGVIRFDMDAFWVIRVLMCAAVFGMLFVYNRLVS
jgi:uncharacterized membrane protein YoaK (UPF0700 family)